MKIVVLTPNSNIKDDDYGFFGCTQSWQLMVFLFCCVSTCDSLFPFLTVQKITYVSERDAQFRKMKIATVLI